MNVRLMCKVKLFFKKNTKPTNIKKKKKNQLEPILKLRGWKVDSDTECNIIQIQIQIQISLSSDITWCRINWKRRLTESIFFSPPLLCEFRKKIFRRQVSQEKEEEKKSDNNFVRSSNGLSCEKSTWKWQSWKWRKLNKTEEAELMSGNILDPIGYTGKRFNYLRVIRGELFDKPSWHIFIVLPSYQVKGNCHYFAFLSQEPVPDRD